MSLNQRVAAGVRAELARKNMGQAELARMLGIGINSLRRRMNNQASFTVDEADAICDLFDVPFSELTRESITLDSVRIIATGDVTVEQH